VSGEQAVDPTTEKLPVAEATPARVDATSERWKPSARWAQVAIGILSQPWVGPSIGLVVLSVSLASLGVAITSLTYTKSGYDRQTERWQADQDNQIQLQLHIDGGLTPDGFRRAYVQLYYRPVEPVRLEKLEATAPDGVMIKADDPVVVKPGTATSNSFELEEGIGPTSQGGSTITVLIDLRTSQTPRDQNSIIQIQASLSELSGKMRHLQRQTRAVIPSDAKR
jgi:hypothetical protein